MHDKKDDPMSRYYAIVARCADDAKDAVCQAAMTGKNERMRLVAVPADPVQRRDGTLHLIPASAPIPTDAVPVCDDMLTADVPYSSYYGWILARAGRSPIIGY